MAGAAEPAARPVSPRLVELDFAPTPLGEVSLRRRREPTSGADVYEVKLGEEYLMSSQFTLGETELARLALQRLDRDALDVVVGGLGLGHTADAVLADERVRALVVVDALAPVLSWHRRGLVPLGSRLVGDARCRLVHGDFFALTAGAGWDPERPDRLFDAILVDIDHSPRHRLVEQSGLDFYSVASTVRLAGRLRPGGVYALWSNDPPDDSYVAVLTEVFADVAAEVVSFPNPLQGGTASNTVYVASARRG